MTDTLAELKAEHAALARRIAKLEGIDVPMPAPPSPPPAPPVERRGVEIRELLDERSDGPSYDELRRLLKIVAPLVPGADKVNKYDPDALQRGFCSCFRRVSNLGRIPAPNPRYAISWWLDETKTWLRARRYHHRRRRCCICRGRDRERRYCFPDARSGARSTLRMRSCPVRRQAARRRCMEARACRQRVAVRALVAGDDAR
jgi:hypothetical protein